ncbi:MAG: hypothetical protein HYS26_03575 [Candidatus Kaiserbacteria bacterium]|nr:MAG: hypothetical protein HYS26_03575 [Candidatus Kaiserbacteria bacterium]
MKQKFDPRRPTYLMSPTPHCWRADGTEYGVVANNFRGGTNPREAGYEWLGAADQLSSKANLAIMPCGRKPQTTFDKLYTADAGAWSDKLKAFVLSNHSAPHRHDESEYVGHFLQKKLRLKVAGSTKSKWEGSSCMRHSPQKTFAILGYGVRAEEASCDEIIDLFGLDPHAVVRIKMKEPHIHLDTLLASLSTRDPLVVVCRSAFAEADGSGWDPDVAYEQLLEFVSAETTSDRGQTQLHCVSSKDGYGYATNIREDPDGHVYAPNGLSIYYSKVLKEYGYKVHPLNLPRLFWDGGGAAACLTNDLSGAVASGWRPPEQYLYWNVRKQIKQEIDSYPEKQICWN